MTADVVHQAQWLASEGFLAAAPDLLRGGTITRCLRDMIRDYATWEGQVFGQIEAVRTWLAARPDCKCGPARYSWSSGLRPPG
jgi:carboxymethylenebutenolidase